MEIADATSLDQFFCHFSSSETKYPSLSNKTLIDGFKRAGELRPLLLAKLDTVIKPITPTEARVTVKLTSSTDSGKDPDKQVGWIRGNQPFQLAVGPFSAPRRAKRQTEPTPGPGEGRLQAAPVPAVCGPVNSIFRQ